MDSQTRTTRSVGEVTKTKTFRSKTLESRRFVTMEPTRSEDVSNIEAGISPISNWLPLDPYLLSWNHDFHSTLSKISLYDFFIEQFDSLLPLGRVGWSGVGGVGRRG